MPDSRADAAAPFLISAVIATYNVARYLPPLLQSLEQQTYGSRNVQFVFVDDGSTDDSLAILQEWAKGREEHVVVLTQPNAWVAEARNAGLAVATGEWVTFTDPDDVLDAGYFAEVAKFIELHGGKANLNLIAAHQMRLLESGQILDNHPQRWKFRLGSRIVNLHAEPIVQLSVNSSFVRMSLIRQYGLSFDDRVRPNFEDAHFIARYMLVTHSGHIGLAASAKYLYRTRGDGSSLLERSFRMREKYTNVLRYGYLALLQTAEATDGIPRWLENLVLYDLFWYYKEQMSLHSLSASAPADVLDEFHDLVREIRGYLADDAIRSFDLMGVPYAAREALLSAYTEDRIRQHFVILRHVDEERQMVKVAYWFSGDLPDERIRIDGREVEAEHATVQDYEYYGRTLIRQRHLWLKRGQRTQIELDEVPQQFVRWELQGQPEGMTSKQIEPRIKGQRAQIRQRWWPKEDTLGGRAKWRFKAWRKKKAKYFSSVSLYDEWVEYSLRRKSVRDRFAHAWVFMDRDTDANDNAEHLYRWVRKNRPEVNAWFVLRKDSTDWVRLEAEGFRLVEHGSWDWKLLMLHADQLASSHADHYVSQPLDERRYGKSRFKYTFLQHGVIHNDMSRWLNWKRIDLLVTTTPDEYEAIAGPGPYAFSSHEVALTGLPRHDELLRKRRAVPAAERDLILVMPTWRQTLLGERKEGSNERAKIKDFASSDYARQITELLASDGLRDLAERTGKRIAFMPHPNMRPYLNDFDLPDRVKLLSFATDNVQEVLARTAAFVTDYSSLAFDAAFLDIPLVYFQFDQKAFFEGSHVGRRGYFDYSDDGFGPVRLTAPDTLSGLVEIAERGFRSSDEYLERTAQAFPRRDTGAAQRVFEAMLRMTGGKVAAPVEVELEQPVQA